MQRRPTPALRPRFHDLTDVAVDRRYAWPPHRHENYECIVVASGRYRCRLAGEELVLGAREALLVKPGDLHEDRLDGPLRYTAVWFACDAPLFATGVRPAAQVARLDRAVRGSISRLRDIAGDPGLAGAGVRDALMVELLWRVLGALPPAALARPLRDDVRDRAFVGELSRLLANELRPMPVAAMAAALGISPAALTHRCRAAFGVSPARALRNHRLDQARAWLERTGEPLAAIAERLGFADQFAFSRAFKRRHRFPPSALR